MSVGVRGTENPWCLSATARCCSRSLPGDSDPEAAPEDE